MSDGKPKATSAQNSPKTATPGPPPTVAEFLPTSAAGIVDKLIPKLLVVGAPGKQLTKNVKENEIIRMCQHAKEVLLSQPPFLELEVPMRLCGDIHGQYSDLLRLFDKGGFPPTSNYLFLGDYVDRGKQNLETICLLLCYKIKYPNNFFLLRGNHECSLINRVYGFYDECNRRYQSFRLWQTFQDVFNVMPFCALIGERILCMHGGLSPQLKNLDQLRQIQRPVDPPNPSMLVDLLWSDPDPWTKGWQSNTRGLSYVFGADVVHEICQKLGIDMVVRAHQVVQDGYEFFANRKLVTLFSAPHYCVRTHKAVQIQVQPPSFNQRSICVIGQFDNAAAMMHVDENLICSFQVLRPRFSPIMPLISPTSSKASSTSNSSEDSKK